MRRLFSLTGIIFLMLGCAAQSGTFGTTEPTEEIAVEVILGNDWLVQKFKVSVVSEGERRKIDDRVAGGEWASTEACFGNICRHGIWITADAVGKGEASVWITLTFQFENGRTCEATKEFQVFKGKSVKRKMKCRSAKADLRLRY